MSRYQREPNPADPDETILRINGVLDARFDFAKAVGPVPKKLAIHLGKVAHANSSVVMPWLTFFRGLREAGIAIRFLELPPALVPYFNTIQDFACGGRIESVAAIFYCKKCGVERTVTLATSGRAAAIAAVEALPCGTCRTPMVFDDRPEWFFRFLPETA